MLDITLSEIPTTPGCYTFHGPDEKALYIGKALNLRARLASHLRDPDVRLVPMLAEASSLTWLECGSEAEALLIEAGQIAAQQPRYNIRLRESDAYPYLALATGANPFARVQRWRGPPRRGVQRFGPWPEREVLDALARVAEEVYGIRSCADTVFRRAQLQGRPCLLAELGRCSAPCVGRITVDEYSGRVVELTGLLRGQTGGAKVKVAELMAVAAAERAFERAARMRDLGLALARVAELQRVQGLEGRSLDAIGLAHSGPLRAIQVCQIRSGALVSSRSWTFEGEGEDTELVARTLAELYREPGRGTGSVTEVLVPVLPAGEFGALLEAHYGRRVRLLVPQRGARRSLVELMVANATSAAARECRRRDADPGRRAETLTQLGAALGIPAPWRIECFDISHTQGQDPVAACIVLEDTLPVPSQYRTIHVAPGGDDYAGMYEAVLRCYAPVAAGRRPAPGLLLIDGGPGQLAAARAALEKLGLTFPSAALAKRLEEVWLDGETTLRLEATDPSLHVLQRARDEAHRFSRARHRARRARSAMRDPLDLPVIPGLGPRRRAALLATFSTRASLEAADIPALVAAGLPDQLAVLLHAGLRSAR